MKNAYKDDSFSARLNSAASAKQASLKRVSAMAGPGDPAFDARKQARDAQIAERKAARAAKLERREAERAAMEAEREAARAREAERLAIEEQERKLAVEAEKVQAKALRDARYAARKARQR